jgi:hypothetical protein
MGSCHVEGDPDDEWRDCGIFDFSLLGLGMDLCHPSSLELMGSRISVCLPVGESIDITLTGEARNAKGGPDGIVRAGIEFVDLSEAERSVVELLERASVDNAKAWLSG